MHLINWLSASFVGITITALIATQPLVWATLAIGASAFVVGMALVVCRGGRKYYAAAGTAYCLGLAGAIYTTGYFPESYAESPYAALLTLGLASGLIVIAQTIGRQLVKRVFGKTTGEEYATAIYDMVAAIVGLAGMVWTVLTAYEKAIRYGGISIGGTIGFTLNALGVELPIPWFIQGGIDASLILFVGCLLIAFHTLESLHTTWHATKQTTKAGASAGLKAGRKASAAASNKRDQFGGEN